MDFKVLFPPIESFGRPIWAYDHLPNGWTLVLRQALFGRTDLLVRRIQYTAQARLAERDLTGLLQHFQVPIYLHGVFHSLNNQHSNPQNWLAGYRAWEDKAFEDYRRRYRP
jgi:hypothetical protein